MSLVSFCSAHPSTLRALMYLLPPNSPETFPVNHSRTASSPLPPAFVAGLITRSGALRQLPGTGRQSQNNMLHSVLHNNIRQAGHASENKQTGLKTSFIITSERLWFNFTFSHNEYLQFQQLKMKCVRVREKEERREEKRERMEEEK